MKKLILFLGIVVLLLTVAPALADWDEGEPNKWVQLPDCSPNGIDIRIDSTDDWMRLGDDFLCTTTGKIRDIHIWGSWYQDMQPPITIPLSP